MSVGSCMIEVIQAEVQLGKLRHTGRTIGWEDSGFTLEFQFTLVWIYTVFRFGMIISMAAPAMASATVSAIHHPRSALTCCWRWPQHWGRLSQASPKMSYRTIPMGKVLKWLQTAFTHLPSNIWAQTDSNSNTILRTEHRILKWWRHTAQVKLCLAMHSKLHLRQADRKMKPHPTHSSSRSGDQDFCHVPLYIITIQ